MAIRTPDENTEIGRRIVALCDIEKGLTDWEVDFVENVSHQKVQFLSTSQVEKINQLYERHCENA
jgi:hypothetical protein